MIGIGLFNPKNHPNVGSALRAAGCYGADFVAQTGRRYKKAPTDTGKMIRRIPLFKVDDLRLVVPHGVVPVAVDLIDGATPLPEYEHPPRAFYIFGPEDGTLGREVTRWCRDVVYVPTRYCMNLGATVNVVLYDRLAKEMR
jgi:tRNA(Leu) C34 or U34 (ribose-2'-O)-methylase TrmL